MAMLGIVKKQSTGYFGSLEHPFMALDRVVGFSQIEDLDQLHSSFHID